MPLVSYAVARRAGAICTRHRTPQLTVPLPKYNGPNRSTHTGTFRTRLTWRIVITLLLTTAHHAGAQRVTGPWDDATIAPRGILRIGISPRFGQWRERLTSDGAREPLGADFTQASLGPALFPFMSGLVPSLTSLTGLPAPALSLGNLATQIDVTE